MLGRASLLSLASSSHRREAGHAVTAISCAFLPKVESQGLGVASSKA